MSLPHGISNIPAHWLGSSFLAILANYLHFRGQRFAYLLTSRLTKIYIIAGKIVRQVQSSKIEDPSKDDQMNQTVCELDRELAEWSENLPDSVRHAANDKKSTKMLALCLTASFVYYSAIINLRMCTPPQFWGISC